jgi:hypothetical protein
VFASRRWTWWALALVVGCAAQLAPAIWRLHGAADPYTADDDEQFYVAMIRHAASGPVTVRNFADPQWPRARSPYGWVMPAAVALPLRAGLPSGWTIDALRVAGSGASAYLLIRIGALVATPEVGAAMAAILLLDPSAVEGKALVAAAGRAAPPWDVAGQLPLSRLYNPGLVLPMFLWAVFALLAMAVRHRQPGPRIVTVVAFAALGACAFFYWWAGAVGGIFAYVLAFRRRRGQCAWALVALGAMLGLVALNMAVGQAGVPSVQLGLRLGFWRTRVPYFLTHATFWVGAAAAAWLLLSRRRLPAAAIALGALTLGTWAVVLGHTALSGWDVESNHFRPLQGAMTVMTVVTLLYHAWRRWGRSAPLRLAGIAAILVTGFAGPFWAVRGLTAAELNGAPAAPAAARAWLNKGGVPEDAIVLVPRALRTPAGAVHAGVVYAYPYLFGWAVPDSVIWDRQVCAAALTGEAPARVFGDAMHVYPYFWPVWWLGRPPGIPVAGLDSYMPIIPRLAVWLRAAVAYAEADSGQLRVACRVAPEYVLAMGRMSVRRALSAGAALGARVRWMASDSSAVWLRLLRHAE